MMLYCRIYQAIAVTKERNDFSLLISSDDLSCLYKHFWTFYSEVGEINLNQEFQTAFKGDFR